MQNIEDKIENIEREIKGLKIVLMQQGVGKKRVSLKGSLKGIKIEESDIEKSRKSLFKV